MNDRPSYDRWITSDQRRQGSHIFHRPRLRSILLVLFLLSSFVRSQTTTLEEIVGPSTTLTESFTSPSSLDTVIYPSNSGSASKSNPSGTIGVAVNTGPITIPQPFDTANLGDTGSNFTSSNCPEFLRTVLTNEAFKACVPFSLLLYTSASFIALARTVTAHINRANILGIIRCIPSPRCVMQCKS